MVETVELEKEIQQTKRKKDFLTITFGINAFRIYSLIIFLLGVFIGYFIWG